MNHNNIRIPNLVILGVGHSGTSILTKILHELGWNSGDADENYGESVRVRAINERALHGDFDLSEASITVAEIPEPWAVKDPRFVFTLDQWLPVFRHYEPTLVWITRDTNSVKKSYSRGDWVRRKKTGWAPPESIRFDLTIEETLDLANRHFKHWEWGKFSLTYEQILRAASLVQFPPPNPNTGLCD